MAALINPNPQLFERKSRPAAERPVGPADEYARECFDAAEIFDIHYPFQRMLW